MYLISIFIMFITFPIALLGYWLMFAPWIWIRLLGVALTYPFCWASMYGFKD